MSLDLVQDLDIFQQKKKKSTFFQVNVYWCHSCSSTFVAHFSSGAVSKNTVKLLGARNLFYPLPNFCAQKIAWHKVGLCLSSGCCNKTPETGWPKQQTFIFSSSPGWEGWAQRASMTGFCWGPSSWLTQGCLLAVSSCGTEIAQWSLPFLIQPWECHPYDVIST